MAQMLLEKPMDYAISVGHNPDGYKELADQLHEVRSRMTPEMNRILHKYETNPELRQIIRNAIPKEGSYHRGSLVSIVSGSRMSAIPGCQGSQPDTTLSAAAELFYWATAWLDDIADENTFRQNTPSICKSEDNLVAMYASNALYGIVMRTIADEFAKNPQKLAQLVDHFSRNFHVINRGQAVDALMTRKKLENVSINDYLSLIEETTGVDIASNIAMGAIAAELDSQTTENLYQFGLRLGTLAQIRDDVLDYCPVQHKGEYVIGKLPFRDLETRKKRLPLLLTGDVNQKILPNEVYDKIEKDFIAPRKAQAMRHLQTATISDEAKDTLSKILKYWSDIRLFQQITS
jgi:geranylgeranyl pyrophosphate synthase